MSAPTPLGSRADEWRFPGDRRRLTALLEDESIRAGLESGKLLAERSAQRARLLGSAVKVESGVLPPLAAAVDTVTNQFPGLGSVECYVYNASDVNAFVTPGRTRTLLALSSAAVNHLNEQELQFVVGHEVGHALFRHNDVSANQLMAGLDLPPTSAMKVRAWQRAAEISADRTGLVACASIEAAAQALFKSASGIVKKDVHVSPARFADQWQRLLEEVADEGQRDFWDVTHPLPPLRMRALLLFSAALESGSVEATEAANSATERMLAMMDPAAGEQTLQDPLLASFFFWGGLYVALADGAVCDKERVRLATVTPAGIDVVREIAVSMSDPRASLEAFVRAHKARRRKLTAVELHRIVYGLIDVASADGQVSNPERERLRELVGVLGVQTRACDLLIAQYEQETRP